MKKILVVAIALIASVSTFAQSTPSTVDAAEWFKKVYVEASFKDPYSYKLLKINIDSINVGQKLLEDINFEEYKLKNDAWDLSFNERNLKTAEKYVKKESDPNGTWHKSVESHKKTIEEITNRPAKILEMKKKYENLPIEEKNKIFYYKFYLDCHANNSYGNPVLGKYVFTHSKGKFNEASIFKTN
jgi:hypothetical protein